MRPGTVGEMAAANAELTQGIGRLLAIVENYLELRSSESFRALQDQLEGTENRIATARRDYVDAVASYNTTVATFPGNIVAGFTGMEKLPQLTIPVEERAVPKVEFGTEGK